METKNEIQLIDNNNLIMEITDNTLENIVLKTNTCATENYEPSKDTFEIVNNNNKIESMEDHPVDIIEIENDNSSEEHENSNLIDAQEEESIEKFEKQEENSIKIMEKLSEKENTIEIQSTENIIEKATSSNKIENIRVNDKYGDKTIQVIEDIQIVSPIETLTDHIHAEQNNEVNSNMVSDIVIENTNYEKIQAEKLATNSESKSVVVNSKSEKNFLPEVTVANYLKNSSLSFLQSQYGTDDSSDDEDDSDDDSIVETTATNEPAKDKEYRDKIIVNSSSDSDDDSDVEYLNTEQQQKIIDLDELIDDNDDDDEQQNNKHKGPIRVKGEFLLEDLPPIQDLKITVPETECVELGKIHSIVDQLVLVDSIPGTVPLDLDTVLFMDKGKTVLGEVFDVLGQIKSPLYCIRFNSNKQIKEKQIEIGQSVFVAPRTKHTQFIILDNLMRIRGSDASWENDIEPTDKHRDFSDDEEETNYRRNLRNKDRPNDHNDLMKKSKRASTSSSSSMCNGGGGDVEEIIESNSQNNQQQRHYNSNNNQRYSGNRRGDYQPRQNQFQRGRGRQNHYQNTSRFNYDNSGGSSWHSNYNNYYGNYQQHHQENSYQHQTQPRYSPHQTPIPQQQQQQQSLSSSIIAQSNLYPNPYAVRPPYIPPNLMQQPLFPPPQPSTSQIVQQPPPPSNYPPQ